VPSENGLKAIRELRLLSPAIDLGPGTESAFKIRAELTRSLSLKWHHIARQFYTKRPIVLSEPVSLSHLPPISFLNLLIEWIDELARHQGRKWTESDSWRWTALKGFVHDDASKGVREFSTDVLRLAKSVAARFSNPPFDNPLLKAWGDWLYFKLPSRPRVRVDSGRRERGRQHDHQFKVLRRFVIDRSVCANDILLLKEFVSSNFRQSLSVDKNKGLLPSKFIAYSAVMDCYLQHLSHMTFRNYVEGVAEWATLLGEPGIQADFEAIQWRFCGRPVVISPRLHKKG
jgi:hypothetical protein